MDRDEKTDKKSRFERLSLEIVISILKWGKIGIVFAKTSWTIIAFQK